MPWRPFLLGITILAVAAVSARCDEANWRAVAEALGKAGAETPDGVYRVGLPRTDLKVIVDGVELKPALALGSWLAFRLTGEKAAVMGDLVLTGEEVSPAMKKLAATGIEVTALHNHLLRALPATFYMHIRAYGDPVKLAAALRDGLALSHTPLAALSTALAPLNLDTTMIDHIIGVLGKANGGVYQLSLKRSGTVSDAGMVVSDTMGTAEVINFQSSGEGKAAISGDLVLTADEVNPVLKILRDNDIEVTALHNHMLDDEPRLFFVHFWANDDLAKLAAGLRAALDYIAIAKQ